MGLLTIIKLAALNQMSLAWKLQYIENKGVEFQAGYWGKEEVFIARLPDMTFIDFHWMDSNEDGTRQYFKPTEIERVVNEIIMQGEKYGYSDLEEMIKGEE